MTTPADDPSAITQMQTWVFTDLPKGPGFAGEPPNCPAFPWRRWRACRWAR
jgi:hypothetical protein